MLRRDVKECHENAVLKNFMVYLEARGVDVELLCKPDPPDAVVKIDERKSWIEITDVFVDDKLAESITSGLASDKPHKPVPKTSRFVVEPAQGFGEKLSESISGKYGKMRNVYDTYGPGILLVGIQTPFSSAECLSLNKLKKPENADSKIFSKIFYYDTSGSAFHEAHFLDGLP